jgi:hypothetical protein
MTETEARRIAERFVDREKTPGWDWQFQSVNQRPTANREWHVVFGAFKDGVL